MKKLALGFTVATILVTGVTGCGEMDAGQGQGQGGQMGQEQGFMGQGQHDGQMGQGVGNQRGIAGQPDGTGIGATNRPHEQRGMMGRETERFGTRAQTGQDGITGFQEGHRQQGFARGIVGNDRPGMVDRNGLLNGRLRAGAGQQGGFFNRGVNEPLQGRGAIDHGPQRGLQQGPVTGQRRDGQQGFQQQERTVDYFETDEGRLARKIENRVEEIEGVQDSDVIISDNTVVIGVDARGNNEQIEERVRSLVVDMDDDKQVHVVTERAGVERIQGMGNQLRDGAPFEEIGATFNAMLDDLGDAVQRPFERTR